MPAPVIYLNGFPGSGKLTIANAVQALIPDSRVLDNHSLIDPVEKIYRRGTMYYASKRAEYRRAVLNPISEDPAFQDMIYIFTDCQTEHNQCMSDYTDLAAEGRRFYRVVVQCEEEENVRRLETPGRGGDSRGKLTDGNALRKMRNSGGGVFGFGDDDEMVVDVTDLSAADAAKKIVAWFEKRQSEPRAYEDF